MCESQGCLVESKTFTPRTIMLQYDNFSWLFLMSDILMACGCCSCCSRNQSLSLGSILEVHVEWQFPCLNLISREHADPPPPPPRMTASFCTGKERWVEGRAAASMEMVDARDLAAAQALTRSPPPLQLMGMA